MDNKYNPAIYASKYQFLSTYHMLTNLVSVCPEDVWKQRFTDVPFWYQVYHCVFFIDYWFRTSYEGEFQAVSKVGQGLPPEFERRVLDSELITQNQMEEYLTALDTKINQFFDGLVDEDLGKSILPNIENFTYQDIIVSQNRHIMYNIGYCNGILRSFGCEESDWWSYNEKEEE